MLRWRLLAVLLPFALALLAAPAVGLAGALRPRWVAPSAVVTSTLTFAALLWGWLSRGGSVFLPWVPALNLHFALTLDGLAALYGLLATGIGALVAVYSAGYLPHYLESQDRAAADQLRFHFLLMLFMGSMVGLVMAQDLLLLFLFWDLTMVSSYFLIGYDRQNAEARYSAFMALLVTGTTSVLFLVGALLLYSAYGTFSLPDLVTIVEPGALLTGAASLMATAALAKSVQVPFHFWLPRAMVAPTPVSAYLHSAAMVAAGVFLLERVYQLVRPSESLLDGLLAVGLTSMLIGGVLALTQDELKQILAYSTIAQYGYVVAMLGLGGIAGVAGASFFVMAHALAKSALFLTAGAVTEATGENQLSRLGGLGRRMPVVATFGGVAAAGLAGLPLTIGFFKDEALFAAALDRGWLFTGLSVLAASLTLAYIWRFWRGLFLGATATEPRLPLPLTLVVPIVALGLATVVGGLYVPPFAHLASAAASASLGSSANLDLAYHWDARPENLLALAVYGIGTLVILTRPLWVRAASGLARLGEWIGPARVYDLTVCRLEATSDWIHNLEVRDLRSRVATILVPTGFLLAAAFGATSAGARFIVGEIGIGDLSLVLVLLLVVAAALITAMAHRQLTLILVLSGTGYSLAAVYAFLGAPDVALVAVLVETTFTLLFLSILSLLPRDELQRLADAPPSRSARWRDPLLSLVTGAFALALTWTILSEPAGSTVATSYISLAPAAHAADVVTAILADFRGLDTLGEMTVIVAGLVGVITLLRGGRVW